MTSRMPFFGLDQTNHSIKILKVDVPRVLKVGDTAKLHCRLSWTSNDELYSLRWWRNNEQFYGYIPKNEEPMMTFNVTGIHVDMTASSESSVVLRNVSVQTSGSFTCEVIADGSFETLREAAVMDVIDPPDGLLPGMEGPIIEVDGAPVGDNPLEYMENQMVKATCQARRSNPPVNLTWYMNNNEMPFMALRRREPWYDGETYSSSLVALFRIAAGDFDQDGQLELKCEATIDDFYSSHARLIIQNPELRRAQLSGFFSSATAIVVVVVAAAVIVVVIVVVVAVVILRKTRWILLRETCSRGYDMKSPMFNRTQDTPDSFPLHFNTPPSPGHLPPPLH
ncbi:uncharacterized protein LOC143032141 isoform X2 [Oratosquilla oratoria]|uniref:uncharacterized protein LOC143032141 isoform X2 n=1 Tax=Oratosquilla oratoria TaxID=337810 RepID=UPI003F76FD0C